MPLPQANDLEKWGMFKEPPSMACGENGSPCPWQEPHKSLSSRHKGKQFGAPYQPKGSGPDAMIDKTTRLSIPGDRYVEPYSMTKDLSARSSIHGKAFFPVGGTKSLGGSGTMYGLFAKPHELLPNEPIPQQGKSTSVGPIAGGKRNIYVNPPKRGTYGFPIQDRSIGGTRFDAMADEYCRGRLVEKAMKQEARARIPKPFVSTGRTNRGIVPMSSYMGAPQPPESKAKAADAPAPAKCWKAPNPSPKGQGYGTLSKIPYIPSASIPPPKRKLPPSGAFKPPGTSHSRQSIWTPNKFEYAARPPPNNEISLMG